MKKIPYGCQSISDDDIACVSSILRGDYLTTGPTIDKFEEHLCQTTTARYAIAVSNCTTALHICCRALGVGIGDVGITSPITFIASANCIEYCGGTVRFVDIDPQTLCLSHDALREYCEQNDPPKVVIAVSFAGSVGSLPEIWKLSQQYGFMVIEDAAHSLGTSYTYDGQTYASGSCTHSHMATLSFHPVKNITTGEGGSILTNSSNLANLSRLLRSHGIERNRELLTSDDGPWYYEMTELGYNYRMTDIQAALGISQLSRLPLFRSKRAQISQIYEEVLSEEEDIITPDSLRKSLNFSTIDTDICRHIYPIQCTAGAPTRKALYHFLLEKGIHCQVHYIPIYRQPYYRNKYNIRETKYPHADNYYDRTLSLPLYPDLTSKELEFIISEVCHGVRKCSSKRHLENIL